MQRTSHFSFAIIVVQLVLSTSFAFAQEDASQPATAASPSDAATPHKVVDFVRDIAPLLRTKCLSCHEGDKAKNDFIISDRTAVMEYIEPGKSMESSFWTDYMIQPSKSIDKESLVMPPNGPLSASELSLLKLWIDEGADWPEGASLAAKAQVNTNGASLARRSYLASGYLHPAIVHFPIAFFLMSGIAVLATYCFGVRFRAFALSCLYIAALTSIVTVVMGWGFAEIRGYPSWDQALTVGSTHDQQNFFFHRWIGTAVAVLSCFVAVLGWSASRQSPERIGHLWRIGVLILAVVIGIVGHQGGELVYGDLFGDALRQFNN